ncbi:39S ribosomal protein L50, mitochondrial isoform X2 [Terrapene carolina triunguis]|uniref:Large ribosomal subunit protein mL50 n=1 Tax=Terrapene triunguis TaxID=2587831 RepID=A0A674K8W1_9SAUR|nr:39S ribosomal protein L50, mitochondrial isoform X2 [Terrapene carolina triunguis]
MATSCGLVRAWRRLSLGVPPRRALWDGLRKKVREPEVVETAVLVKEPPILVCPPPRSRKYLPPEDLQSRLESHVREIFGPSLSEDWQKASLKESKLKYRLLAQLAAELGHAVPNSRLHQMCTAGDVLAFYSTQVKDASKFDELCTAELPSNLKIMWEH